jgi:plasmid replication initiation protein
MKKLSSIVSPMNFEEKPLDKETSEFVVLHNNLVEARYRLTLQEKRIVLWLSSQVTTFDEDFKEHSLSIKDFSKLTNIQGENLYTRLQSITRRLMQRIITIRPIGEKRLIQVAWLGSADYKIDKGIISLSFHPHLKPFFLQLKRNFTKINMVDIIGLKSFYSIRIYELLKQKEYIGIRIITVDEIRDYCGISKEKYKQINHLIKKVLDVAKRDINEKTDIKISYSMVKDGRKYVAVSFDVKNNKKTKKLSELLGKEIKKRDDLIKTIQDYGFSRNTIIKMISEISDFDIEQAILSVNSQVKNGNVKNPKAMIRTALKEKWKPDVFDSKKLKKKKT